MRFKILNIPTTMIEILEGQDWLIDMINNLLLEVLSTMAEHERISTKLRQSKGIAVLNGKGIGGPQTNINTLNQDQKVLLKKNYSRWTNKEITAIEFMKILNLKN